MKVINKKKHALTIIPLLIVFLPLSANHISIKNIFDPLFASTPFKKVVKSCMKVRSSIELVHEYNKDVGLELLVDSVVARLTYLQLDLESMLKNNASYTFTDIEYLLNIIDCMTTEIKQTTAHYTQEHLFTINYMVDSIKNKLEKELEA